MIFELLILVILLAGFLVYLAFILRLKKTSSTEPMTCPRCHQPLKNKIVSPKPGDDESPLVITMTCQNPNCPLSLGNKTLKEVISNSD